MCVCVFVCVCVYVYIGMVKKKKTPLFRRKEVSVGKQGARTDESHGYKRQEEKNNLITQKLENNYNNYYNITCQLYTMQGWYSRILCISCRNIRASLCCFTFEHTKNDRYTHLLR